MMDGRWWIVDTSIIHHPSSIIHIMLLAIDIGNTNISLALFQGNRMRETRDIPLKEYSFSKLLKYIGKVKPHSILICSVVPRMTKKLSKDLKKLTGIKPNTIGKDARVPLKNLYRKPGQLGVDRLVNAYAASKIYSLPVIVVSCGTAITVDAVSKNKEFLGGFILPGLNASLSSLNAATALLPKLRLTSASGIIGKDTRSSILSGVIAGSAGAVDALIRKTCLKTGRNTKIIGTGGDVNLIKKFSKCVRKTDNNLTLKGIFLLNKNSFTKNT